MTGNLHHATGEVFVLVPFELKPRIYADLKAWAKEANKDLQKVVNKFSRLRVIVQARSLLFF